VLLVALGSASGEDLLVKDQPAWLQKTLKAWSDQDSAAAFAELEGSGPSILVAERYATLAQHLYNDRKDLAGTILASRAGIQFALALAKELDATDKARAAEQRGHAKAMAYNLGANCWPGWMEGGITVTSTERAIGLDAARLNLRLAIELHRPPGPLGHAHWLLGAQLLAAERFEDAAEQFIASAKQFGAAKNPAEEQMALAYEKLTRRLQYADDAARREALKQSLAALEAMDNEDARFFADQVRTAEKAFTE
jgi:hypothetical protein